MIKGELFEMNGPKIRKLRFPKMDKTYYLRKMLCFESKTKRTSQRNTT